VGVRFFLVIDELVKYLENRRPGGDEEEKMTKLRWDGLPAVIIRCYFLNTTSTHLPSQRPWVVVAFFLVVVQKAVCIVLCLR